ncbi:hypothetical protein BKA70DRAFT_1116186 [Coprinopsis sp. MPI-PUGE-AT-0042]|nr:hypothetical protein BKA70DRAFT_1116186 [Coprinopsis sp. MPI-PUGE-AT-0042]
MRKRRRLARPHSPQPEAGPSVSNPLASASSSQPIAEGIVTAPQSKLNRFSLWRRYHAPVPPVHDPEGNLTIEDLDDSSPPPFSMPTPQTLGPHGSKGPDSPRSSKAKSYGPFPNASSLLFADWYWNKGNEKSLAEFDGLLNDVFKDQNFVLDDVLGTDWKQVRSALASQDDENGWFDDAGWLTTPVEISVPFHRTMRNPGTTRQTVGNLQHRRILSIIQEKILNVKDARFFHYQPYELYWERDQSSPSIRVHGELYNSPAFMEAHQAVQQLPPVNGCSRERVVVALMFWSDETHLTSFGSAKLWPCYMFFGNESKYRRGKTSLRLCEHIAYLDSVSLLSLSPYLCHNLRLHTE